jgi:hypothetical protein
MPMPPSLGTNEFFFITAPDRSDLYWRPNRMGYTDNIAEAGLYTRLEAKGIEGLGRGDNLVPVDMIKLTELRDTLRKQVDSLNGMIAKIGVPKEEHKRR